MPPYGKRTAVERGIYRDTKGYEVVARVGRFQQAKRFSLDTTARILRLWRDTTVAEMREEKTPTTDARTLAGSIARFRQLSKVDGPTSAALNAWEARHGQIPRRKLTPVVAGQAMEFWKGEGKAPQTLFYRRLALEKLWRILDGPNAKTPVDDIHVSRPKGGRPVWVPDETIIAVAKTLERREQPVGQQRHRTRSGKRRAASGKGKLRTAKTRARFLVLASTGQRPSQLKLAEPEDVDLKQGVWWVRAAKGGDPTPVYLTDDMKAAWAVFIKADAWGTFDRRGFVRALRHSGWPANVRPYNLRHATGLTLSESGTDLRDISSHMGHKNINTTAGFYVPQLHSRLKQLGASLEGRFGWGKATAGTTFAWKCPQGHQDDHALDATAVADMLTCLELGRAALFCDACQESYLLDQGAAVSLLNRLRTW